MQRFSFILFNIRCNYYLFSFQFCALYMRLVIHSHQTINMEGNRKIIRIDKHGWEAVKGEIENRRKFHTNTRHTYATNKCHIRFGLHKQQRTAKETKEKEPMHSNSDVSEGIYNGKKKNAFSLKKKHTKFFSLSFRLSAFGCQFEYAIKWNK